MENDELYCERCDNEYTLKPGKEPSLHCDGCAHILAELYVAESARLREVNAKLLDVAIRAKAYCVDGTLSKAQVYDLAEHAHKALAFAQEKPHA